MTMLFCKVHTARRASPPHPRTRQPGSGRPPQSVQSVAGNDGKASQFRHLPASRSQLSSAIELIFHRFGAVLKDFNRDSRYLLDSFPVPVCDNLRIKRCRIVRDERFRDYLTSNRRYFYGVRAQVVTRPDGVPVEFAVLPGRFADIDGLANLPLDLPPEAHNLSPIRHTRNSNEKNICVKHNASRCSSSPKATSDVRLSIDKAIINNQQLRLINQPRINAD
jgi:hypothetical protein